MRYVRLACETVILGKRELQVIGGGSVYVAMFRRPLLSGLNAIWCGVVELGPGGAAVQLGGRARVLEIHCF